MILQELFPTLPLMDFIFIAVIDKSRIIMKKDGGKLLK